MVSVDSLSFEDLISEVQRLEFLLVVRFSFIQPAVDLARLAEAGHHVRLNQRRAVWYSARLAEYVDTRNKLHTVETEIQRRISFDWTA